MAHPSWLQCDTAWRPAPNIPTHPMMLLLHFPPPQVPPFMGHDLVPTGGSQHRVAGPGRNIPVENLFQHAPSQHVPFQHALSQCQDPSHGGSYMDEGAFSLGSDHFPTLFQGTA